MVVAELRFEGFRCHVIVRDANHRELRGSSRPLPNYKWLNHLRLEGRR